MLFDATRNQMISALQSWGCHYNFSKYTTAQIYNMYRRELAKAQEYKNFDNEYHSSNIGQDVTCDECDARLTDSGECPVCDLGDETFNESKSKLTEATRDQLLTKSKGGRAYSDPSRGSRWTRKSQCRISNNVKDYNRIDMDTFWKKDILSFTTSIAGETDSYDVKIEFNQILNNIQGEVKRAKNKFDRDIVYRALMTSINRGQVKYDCTCDDFKYRLAYQASKNGYKAGPAETRPSDKTNPHDILGAACKHILMMLNNAIWLRNIASVIVNYANYCKDNMQYNYSKYIFPKIFGMDYNKAVQMCIDDFDQNGNLITNMKTDEATINLANALGKVRGRIKPGTNKNPTAQEQEDEKQPDNNGGQQ